MTDLRLTDFTGAGDGTSHKHLNYETKLIAVDHKVLGLGIAQAPNHTSEEQMAGWHNIVAEMYQTYNESPLGKLYPEDPRTFFLKITGMMTDHAADQMKLRSLFKACKLRMDREVRGERALLRLEGADLLEAILQLTGEKIEAAGGMAAWDRLPEAERARINGSLHAELCQRYGQEAFDKLTPEEQEDADFFLGGGCCMHKDLNAHKGEFICSFSSVLRSD